MQTATSCEQWAEESCVDYERDSDDEWFECFDADDLEDAKEEEEEEEVEGEDDRDWLEEDEEAKEKLPAAPAIKFESFLQWTFTFDGEPKPNEADSEPVATMRMRPLRKGAHMDPFVSCWSFCSLCAITPSFTIVHFRFAQCRRRWWPFLHCGMETGARCTVALATTGVR